MGSDRIGLRRDLHPVAVEGDVVYVMSESGGATALRGRHVGTLMPLLDGTRSADAIVAELTHVGVPAAAAGRMVGDLGRAGLLIRRGPDPVGDPAELAFWDGEVADSEYVTALLGRARVGVVTLRGADPGPVRAALRAAGLQVGAADDDVTITVVACSDYLDPDLAAVDREHRTARRPWLLVKPTGRQVWVGPVFRPGSGACWSCLAAALTANRRIDARVLGGGRAALATVRLPAAAALGLQGAALEVVRHLAARDTGLQLLRTWDVLNLRHTDHAVRARPQCPECGDPDVLRRAADRPFVLAERPRHGTTSRSASAEQTLQRHRHLVSPLTGVVTAIRRDTRGPDLFHCFRSGVNRAATRSGIEGLRSALRCDNGGKGVTALDAEVGALCEAVERHSGTFHGDEPLVETTLAALGDRAVHPDAVRLFHPDQHGGRAAWNARHSAFQHVPPPFDAGGAIPWSPLWSLTADRRVYLPTAMLWFDGPGPEGLHADSNGCAAGASREDAVLQGLLELVERDAVALWWYNRTRAPEVDLRDPGDPWISEVLAAYAGVGREVWVLDVSADLPVPVMAAVSRAVDGGPEDIMVGFGAHLDRRSAVRRALTELNQVMPTLLALRHDRSAVERDVDLRRWLDTATVAGQPYLAPGHGSVPVVDPAPVRSARIDDDVRALVRDLAQRGLEVLVLDQTRPEVGLPVVRVVVPGLRHFWARFAPGRLYDVPVRLGRVPAPVPRERLNPLPVFM